MRKDVTICVGTIGSGIWRSPDGGETWTRVRPSRYPENDVRALAVHPRAPHIVYAGTDSGVYRSEDRGTRWERLDAPMNAMHTWALAIDPAEPETLFAGTQPSAVFRSRDGGQRWAKLALELAAECPAVVIPRVTALVVDPEDHRTIWVGIEVDGCVGAWMAGRPGRPAPVGWATRTSTASRSGGASPRRFSPPRRAKSSPAPTRARAGSDWR